MKYIKRKKNNFFTVAGNNILSIRKLCDGFI